MSETLRALTEMARKNGGMDRFSSREVADQSVVAVRRDFLRSSQATRGKACKTRRSPTEIPANSWLVAIFG